MPAHFTTLRETADVLLEQSGPTTFWITDKSGFTVGYEDDDGYPLHRERQLTMHTYFGIVADVEDMLDRTDREFNRIAAQWLGLSSFEARTEFPPIVEVDPHDHANYDLAAE